MGGYASSIILLSAWASLAVFHFRANLVILVKCCGARRCPQGFNVSIAHTLPHG